MAQRPALQTDASTGLQHGDWRHSTRAVAVLAAAAVAALTACGPVAAATSDLPAGSVGFRVDTFHAPEWEQEGVARCFDRTSVMEGVRRGFSYAFSTWPNTAQGANRRLHICLQAATHEPVEAQPLNPR